MAVGPAPWSSGYKRVNKRTAKKSNVEWSLSSGWRYKAEQDWDKQPKKPKTRRLRLYNGREVEVPIDDYQDFIGHQASPTSDPDSDIGKYIYKAFIEKEDSVKSVRGVGHIDEIQYAPTYQLLQVYFKSDGAAVVFFRVPKEVYSELAYLAEAGTTFIDKKGVSRHVLGKVFWDIVRIRGQITGSRYRYEYTQAGERKGQTVSSSEVAAEKAGTKEKEIIELDKLAASFLSGNNLNKYKEQKSYTDKEKFLKKAGIL